MAKMKINPAMGEISGLIGDLVFTRYKTGIAVLKKRPTRTAPPTSAEVVNQKGFAESVAYAKRVWAEQPELRAKYQAAGRLHGRQGFNVAKSDFRRPPKVTDIVCASYTGKAGQPIRIEATDDFAVARVEVVIRSLNGQVLEQGAAVLNGTEWVYTSTSQVPAGQTVVIEATATDHPGHTGIKQTDHACGPRN